MEKTFPCPTGTVEWNVFSKILEFIGHDLYVLLKSIWDRKKVRIGGKRVLSLCFTH